MIVSLQIQVLSEASRIQLEILDKILWQQVEGKIS